MGDFLRFETMITPVLIQVIFWLAVLASLVIGIMAIVSGEQFGVLVGIAIIIFGPIVARIYAEILIVVFRINEHLRQIQHNTQHA